MRPHSSGVHHGSHFGPHTTSLPPLLEMNDCGTSDRRIFSSVPHHAVSGQPPPPHPPPDFSAMQLAAAAGLEHYFSAGRTSSSSIESCLYPNAFQPLPPPPPPPPPLPSPPQMVLPSAATPISQIIQPVQSPADFGMQKWINRSIASEKLRLVELCAFVEYPCQMSDSTAQDLVS